MPCKHCHKPKEKQTTMGLLYFPRVPFCKVCYTQHSGPCPKFPRDAFPPGTSATTIGLWDEEKLKKWKEANK